MPQPTYMERWAMIWAAMQDKERELQEQANFEVIRAYLEQHAQRPVELVDVLDKEHSG